MQRTIASFALAITSLLASYAIVASWPDGVAPDKTAIAQVAPAVAPIKATRDSMVLIGLAD
jgi:hypothetical protein